jgi:hypothetical protein
MTKPVFLRSDKVDHNEFQDLEGTPFIVFEICYLFWRELYEKEEVLGSKIRLSLLQGYALLDNDAAEDWPVPRINMHA